ncbi:MAG: hypothetical protein SO193_08660 [Sodaliphilus sp.]|nr:hypothetical protein [Sodaliphilus sp.]
MDHKFTEQIRLWLETHEDERDYAVGALQTKGTVLSVYKPKEPSLWFVVCDFT